ncbi:ABC transporter permease [Streptomyces rugosispiralis]|uniref:ABC transporter permease n=1 Tax=Streptomyces rugosispiralis TaxID=2967341 RepID=A0ABT1UP50_9ACTN|nr:ABC transporter permease [Streptomyces rugosispiralis]MCQ8186911.1 ABC transporter permease [Streptomyces rugosispiralis]
MSSAVLPGPAARRTGGRAGKRLAAMASPLVQAIVVTLLVMVITFFLIRTLLGDPAVVLIGGNTGASPQRIAALRAELGLDKPLPAQFLDYVAGLLHGDLGNSFQHPTTTVASVVVNGAGVTFALVGVVLLISCVVGIGVGLLAAGGDWPVFDNIIRVFSLIGLAAPGALIGLVLILTAALGGRLFPAGGWGSGYPDNFQYLILPAVTVSFWLTPIILRAVRERAGEVLHEPFAESAAARGMSRTRLMLRHVAPNCAGPVLAIIGVSLSYLISGAVIVEIVYGLPGIGRAMTTAVGSLDFPVIQGIVLLTGAVVVVLNLIIEIATRVIDPRAAR